MAKIEKPKARKEYTCSACKEVIKVGDTYLKGTPFRCKPIIRCLKCGLRSWELSSSDYVRGVGRVRDCWREDYGCDESTAQSIADELSNIKNDIECSFDNMPYQLQDGDTGQLLQERMDNLDQAISDLECIDYEDDIVVEAKSDVDESSEKYEEELQETIEELLTGCIEDALECLDY